MGHITLQNLEPSVGGPVDPHFAHPNHPRHGGLRVDLQYPPGVSQDLQTTNADQMSR